MTTKQKPTVVQTLIFDKSKFTQEQAVKWSTDHNYKGDKVDETETSYRLRQREPGDFVEDSFRTIELTDGVQAVIGHLKDGKSVGTVTVRTTGIDWKSAIAKREVVEMYCTLSIKGPQPAGQDTPAANPVTGETILKDDEPLRCAGIANANVADRVDERLDPQGCVLVNYLRNPIFLANHAYNVQSAIGQVDMIESREDGVHFEAWVGDPKKAQLTDLQKQVRSLMAQGILRTVSVGFIPMEVREPLFNEAGILQEPMAITKWELLEISIVPVPCNAGALFDLKENRIKTMERAAQMKSFPETSKTDTLNVIESKNNSVLQKQPGQEIGLMEELLKELVVEVRSIHEICNRTMGMCEKIQSALTEDDQPETPQPSNEPTIEGESQKPSDEEPKKEIQEIKTALSQLAMAVKLLAARLDAK